MKDVTRKVLLIIVPIIGYGIMRLIWWTSKKNIIINDDFSQEQHIFVCWHGELLMSPQAYRSLHKKHRAFAMISHHFDGELIARVYGLLGIGAIRGSGRKGSKEVFLKAFRTLKEGDELLITPDGPRGPRHHVHDGAVALSIKGKVPICTVNFTCSRYWQLKSWDRFIIPKPFSTIDFHIQSFRLESMEMEEAKVFLHDKMLEHTIVET